MPLPPKDERIEIRAPSADVERWRATADSESMTLSDWIRRRLNEVALDEETIAEILRKTREREAKLRKGRR